MNIEQSDLNERPQSPLLQHFIRDVRSGPQAWGEAFENLGAALNIRPNYIQSNSTEFREFREDLNTRAGILISNHPSALDMCLIFPALKRGDLLFMVQEKRFEFLATLLGPEHIVQASSDPKALNEITDRIIRHIEAGGLFIIFPSGGEEVKTNALQFRSGFRHLISRLHSDAMVYSFYIDPNDAKKITEKIIGPPRGSEDKASQIAPNLHVRPLTEALTVKVRENCSDAREWQQLLSTNPQLSTPEKNNLLANHFLDKFTAAA